MKKLLYIFVLIILFAGCEKENKTIHTIELSTNHITFEDLDVPIPVTIKASGKWIISFTPNAISQWVTVSKAAGEKGETQITVSPSTNMGNARSVSIDIQIGSKKESIIVEQKALNTNNYYQEGEVTKLASATVGNGVDLVFMGDGFTLPDLYKATESKYLNSIKQAVEHFFAIEPYKSRRAYFNIYMVAAISQESGITNYPIGKTYNTRFKTQFHATDPNSTATSCDYTLCESYAQLIPNLDPIGDVNVILVLNSVKYSGTCMIRMDGFSVAMCPMSNSQYPYDFRGLIQHEAGGHGFGRLSDEYQNNSGTIPASDVTLAKLRQTNYNLGRNVDFTNNLSEILWKDFIGVAKYSNVGAYEGGYYYMFGVWRATQTNCMINNIPYYNPVCRYEITRRIMRIAGQDFTFQDFVNTDPIVVVPTAPTKGFGPEMPPLAPPILVE